MLNKTLNKCLDFPSLIEDFAATKARKHLFQISFTFGVVKKSTKNLLVSTEAHCLVVYR